MPSPLSRRRLLTGAGVAATAGLAYAGARAAADRGTVVVRHVSGETVENGTLRDQTELFHAELDRDGPTERRVHPEYRDWFPDERPLDVSRALHRRLEAEFDEVAYYLGQNCPNTQCSTPRVSRGDFNEAAVGETVRLLHHGGAWAKLIP